MSLADIARDSPGSKGWSERAVLTYAACVWIGRAGW